MNKILVILIVIVIAAGSVVGTLFLLNNNNQDNQPKAVLEILSLSVDKHNQFVGEDINVSVEVQNIGDAHGDLPVNITIDGQKFSIVDYNYMGPGEKKTITKNFTKFEEKNYSIDAGIYTDTCKFWEKHKVGMSFEYRLTNESSSTEPYVSGFVSELSSDSISIHWNDSIDEVNVIYTYPTDIVTYFFFVEDYDNEESIVLAQRLTYVGKTYVDVPCGHIYCDHYDFSILWFEYDVFVVNGFVIKISVIDLQQIEHNMELVSSNIEYLTLIGGDLG